MAVLSSAKAMSSLVYRSLINYLLLGVEAGGEPTPPTILWQISNLPSGFRHFLPFVRGHQVVDGDGSGFV